MRLRSWLTGGMCAALVPLLGATGNWSEPMGVALLADVHAPAAGAVGQAPAADRIPVRAARLERREATDGLRSAIDDIRRSEARPVWIAWSVPAVPADEQRPRSGPGRSTGPPTLVARESNCVLDDEGRIESRGDSMNRGARSLTILVRSEPAGLTGAAFSNVDCTVEAGARTVYWVERVSPPDSVGVLAAIVARAPVGGDREQDESPVRSALPALALHADPAADRALTAFVAPGQPRWLRRDAAFWLGAARGEEGGRVVQALARQDGDDDFREHLTFVLTLTGEAGLKTLLDLARRDASAQVRKQALFWVAQKAGERALPTLSQAVVEDPDREVRRHAVFALSRLPSDEGVPRLIDVARTHRDPEVRKQAMFWLGQSGDERALAFFESVLAR